MKAKYGAISQLGRIVPVPMCVGDDYRALPDTWKPRGLSNLEVLVQPPQHSQRQDHLTILGLLVIAAQQVCDRPDKRGEVLLVHVCSFHVFAVRTGSVIFQFQWLTTNNTGSERNFAPIKTPLSAYPYSTGFRAICCQRSTSQFKRHPRPPSEITNVTSFFLCVIKLTIFIYII